MRPDLPFKPGQPAERVTVQEGYDRWAAIYDEEDNPLIALESRHLPAALGAVANLDLLDLGCGTGRHALRCAAQGARVTAVDFAGEMLTLARRKPGADRVRFIEHDLERPLPLPDAAFDRVLSCLVMEHLRDLTAFMAEARRVCRPDGRIVVTHLHPAMMLRGIQAHFRDPVSGHDVCPASYAHEISDYVLAAVRAGLTIDLMSEHAVDAELAASSPRAAKYEGWPMLLLTRLRPAR